MQLLWSPLRINSMRRFKSKLMSTRNPSLLWVNLITVGKPINKKLLIDWDRSCNHPTMRIPKRRRSNRKRSTRRCFKHLSRSNRVKLFSCSSFRTRKPGIWNHLTKSMVRIKPRPRSSRARQQIFKRSCSSSMLRQWNPRSKRVILIRTWKS